MLPTAVIAPLTGRVIAAAALSMGAKIDATNDRGPSTGESSPPRRSSVMSVNDTRSRTASTRRVRRESLTPHYRRTGLLPPSRSVPRLGDQDLLECLELLDALARPERDGVERVVGDVDRHPGLVAQSLVEPLEQRAAT